MALSVAPIVIAAVRNGLRHWMPTQDAALTTLRVKDVFSAHPPLVGMAALTSAYGPHPYSFPGALQLYLLAVPVKLLGTTWGPLVGKAAINSVPDLGRLALATEGRICRCDHRVRVPRHARVGHRQPGGPGDSDRCAGPPPTAGPRSVGSRRAGSS